MAGKAKKDKSSTKMDKERNKSKMGSKPGSKIEVQAEAEPVPADSQLTVQSEPEVTVVLEKVEKPEIVLHPVTGKALSVSLLQSNANLTI